jgi:toxin ParE1/3/4
MKNKQVRFHPEARLELRAAIQWYRDQDRAVATELRATVTNGLREIALSPQRWLKYLHGTHRYVLQRFPFTIVYLEQEEWVSIVAIAHGKRKPGYWRNRL